MRGLAAITSALAALCFAATAGAQTMLVEPADPGPADAGGNSALAGLFPDGVPWPFERLLDRLRDEAGADNLETALIPLGRSSQRMAAHPDFFASPRIVAAVTGDWASGPGAPTLANRVFLAYQPAAGEILSIAWNDTAGRHEFERIAGYGEGADNRIERAERADCIVCHQGHGPVFSRPLWSETAASAAVARTLVPLGTRFQGVPVAANVDGLFELDEATDRGARLILARRLWAEGCPDRKCRAVLLANALSYGLNGRRPDWVPLGRPEVTVFEEHARRLWPTGLAVPSADLPDRDPIAALGALSPAEVTDELLASVGAENPATARPPHVVWHPDSGYVAAVRAVAEALSSGDFDWIDGRMSVASAPRQRRSLVCDREIVEYGGSRELRFRCTSSGLRLHGFLTGSDAGIRGRIDSFEVTRAGSIVARPAVAVENEGKLIVRLPGPGARLADGRRLAEMTVERTARGALVEVVLVNEMEPLSQGLERLAGGDHPLFEPDGLSRDRALDAIERVLGSSEAGN